MGAVPNLSKEQALPLSNDEPTTIPVVREEPVVRKRSVETGSGVRIAKTVAQREHVVDEMLAKDDVVVERVSIGRAVDAANLPGIRYEGDTMIVPVLEEILVAEKRTILKEELRITSTRREVREQQRVVLRSEEVSVDPFEARLDTGSNLP
jgi:stress response protein YsnF